MAIEPELPQSQPSSSGTHGPNTTVDEHLPGDLKRVGKITFNTGKVLGRGSYGTVVFKGKFEDKIDVAVKCLPRNRSTIAEREFSLLIELDRHPNVIRYYCTEQDEKFIYRALELCEGTLQDYIQRDSKYRSFTTSLEIARQATNAVAYLHSLGIIHRNINPSKFLLRRNILGEIQVMLSGFAVSKKLQENEEWILVKRFKRQFNILKGRYTLDKLKGDEFRVELFRFFISKLISYNAGDRPPAAVVLKCPLNWNNEKSLYFIVDISNKLERKREKKQEVTISKDQLSKALERNAALVVGDNWLKHIDPEVKDALQTYRKYRGDSVVDLLRAIRNMMNHYETISAEAQRILGSLKDEFTSYWFKKFPKLLLHTWLAVQCSQEETIRENYYPSNFKFNENIYGNIIYPRNLQNLIRNRLPSSSSIGVIGTEGWIAPEMYIENEQWQCAVDSFSLGILFYKMMSEGEHPFDDRGNVVEFECHIPILSNGKYRY